MMWLSEATSHPVEMVNNILLKYIISAILQSKSEICKNPYMNLPSS
jgi:hypothetical protein